MKTKILCLLLLVSMYANAQVGIGTTDPKALLDIKSTNQASPSSTDGMLVPKVDTFPATNPGVDQQSMMVYLTTTVGTNLPGFYYWNNPTTTWIPIGGDKGTLDQAYDFGGAGNGRTITADTGAVLINGSDGLVSTGTSGFGAIAPSGAGTKMFWNPRKVAFRAGLASGTEWDDANIGSVSVAFGSGTRASANFSTAFGFGTSAIGQVSTAFGQNTTASGANSAAFGLSSNASGSGSVVFGNFNLASGADSAAFGINSTASGNFSTSFGRISIASGENSFVNGINNSARSFGETVLGIGATLYTPSANGTTQFRSANINDRLFVIGNAIDSNNSGFVDAAERNDAMVILKNGLTRLPSTTNAMIDAADGKAIVTKEFLQTNSSGTLDQAYDFGGAGNGRTITADTGAVLIDGTDGFVSTGTINNGAIAPSGAGVKMFWNPRKAAFRAGSVSGAQWDDASIGQNSTAFGIGTTASGNTSTAFGSGAIANGIASTAFGVNTNASATRSTAFGSSSSASAFSSTAFGNATSANGSISTVFGNQNTAASFGETVLGIGATTYTVTANGATEFRTANATDRLFVVGNAIDTNNNSTVDDSERSDALVVLKNGNTGIGTSIPVRKLHVLAGTSTGVTPFSGAPFVLESNGDAYQQFLTPNVSAAAGSGLLFGTTAGNIRGGVVFAALDEKLDFRTGGNTARMTILNNGLVGIGTATPERKLHVFNGASGGTSNGNTGILLESSANVYQHFLTPSSNEKGLLFGSEVASIQGGIIFNSATAVNGLLFRTGGNTNRMTITDVGDVGIATTNPTQRLDVGVGNIEVAQGDIYLGAANGVLNAGGGLMVSTINYIGDTFVTPTIVTGDEDLYIGDDLELGGQGFKPGGGAWGTASDRQLKKNILPYSDGLETLLKINPVTYQYNNKFKTLDTGETYVGIIAQELEKIAPYMISSKAFGQVVEEDENGIERIVSPGTEYLTYDSSAMTYMLINAVKEISEDKQVLQSEVLVLKQEIEVQKNTLQNILRRLETIENKNN